MPLPILQCPGGCRHQPLLQSPTEAASLGCCLQALFAPLPLAAAASSPRASCCPPPIVSEPGAFRAWVRALPPTPVPTKPPHQEAAAFSHRGSNIWARGWHVAPGGTCERVQLASWSGHRARGTRDRLGQGHRAQREQAQRQRGCQPGPWPLGPFNHPGLADGGRQPCG